ncbi:MAG: hypothetical protein JSR59_04060 [Proteobacteria bacterium]|nr:hypothetical protein [Pseudomonadota bacterium]
MTKPRSRLEKLSWIAGIVSAILAAVALLYTFAMPRVDGGVPGVTQTAGPAATQIGHVGGNVTIYQPASPASEKKVEEKLAAVFVSNTIGGSIKYLETILGPAKRVLELRQENREYDVEGCKLTLAATKEGTVVAMTLVVSPSCTFNWRGILPNHSSLPQPNHMTFGDAMKSSGSWTFVTDCLDACGNAADPVAELRIGGSHADGWLMAVLGAVIDSKENLEASDALRKKLESKMGRDWVIDGKFQCDYDLNSSVVGVVESMRVNFVTIRAVDSGSEPEVGDNAKCR